MRKIIMLLILFVSICGTVVAYSGDNPLQLQIVEEKTIPDTGIKLFDVSNEGSFAIAFSRESSEEIRIYSDSGWYMFSYIIFPKGDYAMKLNDDYSISILIIDERFMVTYGSSGILIDQIRYESDDAAFDDKFEEIKQENLKCISWNNTVYFNDVYYNDVLVYLKVTDGNISLVRSSPRGMVVDENNKTQPLKLQIVEEKTIPDTEIKLFDVSDENSFAIAFSRESSEEIRIYSSTGRYMFSYIIFPQGDYSMKLNADYSISILAADERFMVTYDSNGSLTDRRNYESNDDTFADIYEEMKQENLKCISRNNTVYFKDAHYNDISVYLRVTDGNLNLIKSSPQGMVEDKNNAVLYILFIAAFLIFITVLVIFVLKEKIVKTKKAHKQADDVSCHHDFESNINNEKE